jgi:Tfp pilus assembly protein PilX
MIDARKTNNSSGMILISVLIFMTLITLLVTTGLGVGELQMRMSSNTQQQVQVFQVAQAGIKDAFENLRHSNVSCQIAIHSAYDLLTKSRSWWQSDISCHKKLADYNYYYVVESLQINPCLTFADSSAVQYWRITTRAERSDKNTAVTILQATIVLPAVSDELCEASKHQLLNVWQSWRQLRG